MSEHEELLAKLDDILIAIGSAPVVRPPPDPGTPPPVGSSAQTRGFWLPIIGGTVGQVNQAYTSQHGRWVKSGYLYHVWASLQLSVKGTIDGNLQLKGLQLKTATQPVFYGGICTYSSNLSPDAAGLSGIQLQCGGVRDTVDLYGFRPGQNPRPLTGADINDHTQLMFTMIYEVDE